MSEVVDAVVVGAGPNGLVAANALADAGWDVLVLEAQDTPGGAVRTAETTRPHFRTDLFSAFYPFAAASPVLRDLGLDAYGLRWVHAPDVLAHTLDDGRTAVLHRRPEDTAAGLDRAHPGDGAAWLRMVDAWTAVRDPLLDALFRPFPPVRPAVRLLRRLGAAGTLDLARLALLPVRRLADEEFGGEGPALLLTGNAMHADVPPDAAGSGLYGWLLTMLGQDVGFPVPAGGAGGLAGALVGRLVAAGGAVRTRAAVEQVLVRHGRAVGVRTHDGRVVLARRAVLADVSAPGLYEDLVGTEHLPPALRRALRRFQWDHPTVKVDWALAGPVPWRGDGARGAGTVHLGVDRDGFVAASAALSTGRQPERPFVVLGQMSTADPSRSPAGTESAWAYTHLPHRPAGAGRWTDGAGRWTDGEARAAADRLQAAVERAAPGFSDLVLARQVQGPADLHGADANLFHGAIGGGTSAPHQQLVLRPTPGLGRAETPVERLYLASASAHPGGGVHGACGWNAALAALRDAGPTGPLRRRLLRTAWSRLLS